MENYRFHISCAGFNIHDGWFLIVGSVFENDPKSIIAIAKKEVDNCSIDKIIQEDNKTFRIYI